MFATVHPCGQPASTLSARRCSPLVAMSTQDVLVVNLRLSKTPTAGDSMNEGDRRCEWRELTPSTNARCAERLTRTMSASPIRSRSLPRPWSGVPCPWLGAIPPQDTHLRHRHQGGNRHRLWGLNGENGDNTSKKPPQPSLREQ